MHLNRQLTLCLVPFIALLLIATAAFPSIAHAQIEVGMDGRTGVGMSPSQDSDELTRLDVSIDSDSIQGGSDAHSIRGFRSRSIAPSTSFSYGGDFESEAGITAYGIRSEAYSERFAHGISVDVESLEKTYGVNLYLTGYDADENYGIKSHISGNSAVWNYGMYNTISANNAKNNMGIYNYIYATNTDSTNNTYGVKHSITANGNVYGVYSEVIDFGYIGGKKYAGYFAGDVHVEGSFTNPSDRKLKKEIRALGGQPEFTRESGSKTSSNDVGPGADQVDVALNSGPNRSTAREKLLQLRPRTYQYRRDEYNALSLPAGKRYGLIAQEVEGLFPELVKQAVHPGEEVRDDDGEVVEQKPSIRYKSIDYMQLVPIVLQTVREQQAEIDTLRAELEALKEAVQDQGISVE